MSNAYALFSRSPSLSERRLLEFDMSCSLLVELVDPPAAAPTDYKRVLKIFDFQHACGLRAAFNCGDFTLDRAEVAQEQLRSGRFANLADWFQPRFQVPDSPDCSALQRNNEGFATKYSLESFACDRAWAIHAAKNFDKYFLPCFTLSEQDEFLFITQQLCFCHEREVFHATKGIGFLPSFIGSGAIKSMSTPGTEFPEPQVIQHPAIMMSVTPGQALMSLDDHPASSLMTLTDDEYHALHIQLHTCLVYGLWCRGLQYCKKGVVFGDILISIEEATSRFRSLNASLIDMGLVRILDPRYAETYSSRNRCRLPPQSPYSTALLDMEPERRSPATLCRFDPYLEQKIQYLARKFSSISYKSSSLFKTVDTQRFRRFGNCDDLLHGRECTRICDTITWRFTMESLFASIACSGTLRKPEIFATTLRYACRLMDREWNSVGESNPWVLRAIVRLFYLVDESTPPIQDESNINFSYLITTLSCALETEPASFNHATAIKTIQKWAASSELWQTAIWHSADLSDEAILDFLSARFVEAERSCISSILEMSSIKILRSHPLLSGKAVPRQWAGWRFFPFWPDRY